MEMMTDTDRLEWLMKRMYRLEGDPIFENDQPRQDWHMVQFSIPRGTVAIEDFMHDMRVVIDCAAGFSGG